MELYYKEWILLTRTESFVRGVSSIILSYTEGESKRYDGGLNRSSVETVCDCFISFGKGLALYFAGIVTKPI